MWYSNVASVICNLLCGNSIMRYCSATLTTCNLHCSEYIIRYCNMELVTCNLHWARCVMRSCIAALMTCNLNCTNSITCNCNVTLTTCNLQGAIILYLISLQNWWISIFTEPAALCIIALPHWWLAFCTVEIIFVAFLFGCIKFSEQERSTNYLSPLYKRFQSFPSIQWCDGEILAILGDSPLESKALKYKPPSSSEYITLSTFRVLVDY